MMKTTPRLWLALCGAATLCLSASAYAQSPSYPAPAYGVAPAATAPAVAAPSGIAALTDAVRMNPFDPVALNNLAVQYASAGDYPNAVALLERAQRLAPNRTDITNNLANLKGWMAQGGQPPAAAVAAAQQPGYLQAQDLPPLWSGPTAAPARATTPTTATTRGPVDAPVAPALKSNSSNSNVVEGPSASSRSWTEERSYTTRSSRSKKHKRSSKRSSPSNGEVIISSDSATPTPAASTTTATPRKKRVKQRLVLDCPPT